MKIEFTPGIAQAKMFPPEPIKLNPPEWFRNAGLAAPGAKDNPTAKELQLDPSVQASTIKRCVPAVDYMTSGYVIKSFLDIKITQENVDGIENVYYFHNTRVGAPFIDKHKKGQFPGVDENKEVLKISGVWGIKTPPGYSSLIYQPYYNLEDKWQFLPAIVDTDVYTNPVSFPFILSDIPLGETREIYIEAGTPLVCVFPFKRDSWESVVHEDLIKNDKSRMIMFTQLKSIYKRFFHKKKKYT